MITSESDALRRWILEAKEKLFEINFQFLPSYGIDRVKLEELCISPLMVFMLLVYIYVYIFIVNCKILNSCRLFVSS